MAGPSITGAAILLSSFTLPSSAEARPDSIATSAPVAATREPTSQASIPSSQTAPRTQTASAATQPKEPASVGATPINASTGTHAAEKPPIHPLTRLRDWFVQRIGESWSDTLLPLGVFLATAAGAIWLDRTRFRRREFSEKILSYTVWKVKDDPRLFKFTYEMESLPALLSYSRSLRSLVDRAKKAVNTNLALLHFNADDVAVVWDEIKNSISARKGVDILEAIGGFGREDTRVGTYYLGWTYQKLTTSKHRILTLSPQQIESLVTDPKSWLGSADGVIDEYRHSSHIRLLTAVKLAVLITLCKPPGMECLGAERLEKCVHHAQRMRALLVQDFSQSWKTLERLCSDPQYSPELSSHEEEQVRQIITSGGNHGRQWFQELHLLFAVPKPAQAPLL